MITRNLIAAAASVALLASTADACTRLLYETSKGDYIVGRTLDWPFCPALIGPRTGSHGSAGT
ncbi:hypothetical protein [Tropicibacter sp. Alg240-R139]|uniref:hypothetical protein n=1 Tax=Tropicibacter sp. Alg240-R139 TaxID=2305991 RepID=UPI0013DF1926|nr:hypothetical protein [Tropicibacter sp. Alg240-R139]